MPIFLQQKNSLEGSLKIKKATPLKEGGCNKL
jgi:hypothetical protein